MKNKVDFKIGDAVKYTDFGSVEYGWIKSLSDDPDYVFVVYASKGSDFINETNYKQFTAQRTYIGDLEKV